MKKRIAILVVAMMISGAALFANGQSEDTSAAQAPYGMYGGGPGNRGAGPKGGGPGFMGGPGAFNQANLQPITVTGSVIIDDNWGIALNDGTNSYFLMCPYFMAGSVDISAVKTATVEGFLVPAPRWNADGSMKAIRVTRVTIDGVVFNFGAPRMAAPNNVQPAPSN